MTKIICELELNLSPETIEHAQHIIDEWVKNQPVEIKVLKVLE